MNGNNDLKKSTQIDLGDDLLEKTASIASPSHAPISNSLFSELRPIPELLQKAKDLLNQESTDSAKKTLYLILIQDPHHLEANRYLQQLYQKEIQILLQHLPSPHLEPPASSSHLMSLENLTLSNSLKSEPLIHALLLDLEKQLFKIQATARDWIDLGIAFLEMELPTISIQLFKGAQRHLQDDSQWTLSFIALHCLQAWAYLILEQPFAALRLLQECTQRIELPLGNRIEVCYLFGRTYELLKRDDLMKFYFQEVIKINSDYRDIQDRIQEVHR